MFYTTYRITRADLYEKVWSSPMLKIAKEIGISDVALGKACRRASIPVPPQGYWLKKNKPATRPILPEAPRGQLDDLEFQVLDLAEVERLRKDIPPVPTLPAGVPFPQVPDSLHGAHPLVAATKRRGTEDFHGRVYLTAGSLDLRVSADQLHRCQRIASALIKASESAGYCWEVKDGKTLVHSCGVNFQVHFNERISKQPSTSKDRYAGPDWVSTGELAFLVDTYTPEPVRKQWKDSSTGSLEERLADAIATFPAIVAGIQLHDAQLGEWKRRWKEEEERKELAAKNAAIRRRLRDRLADTTSAWENAQRIRELCSAVDERIPAMPEQDREAATRWLEWARHQAEVLDPLSRPLEKWARLSADSSTFLTETEKKRAHWWEGID